MDTVSLLKEVEAAEIVRARETAALLLEVA